MKILNWKTIERHPLSAEYADLEGEEWDAFLANVRELGILLGRKITLRDGKVLDGWQLLKACRRLNIEPEFNPLPIEIDPEKFVRTVNDRRRHMTPEQRAKLAEERRCRVAEARVSGHSIRQIAQSENVSKATIESDLGKLGNPPVQGGTVVGLDGKKRSSTTTARLCDRCKRVGPIRDCSACASIRETPTKSSVGSSRARQKPEDPAEPAVLTYPCAGPVKEWALTQKKIDEYTESFPGVDVLGEAKKALQWCRDNGSKRKTAKGMPAFLGSWLARQQNRSALTASGKKRCPNCGGSGFVGDAKPAETLQDRVSRIMAEPNGVVQ